jgi:hypothetical protein
MKDRGIEYGAPGVEERARRWAAMLVGAFIVAPSALAQSKGAAANFDDDKIAFLSERRGDETDRPTEETPSSVPQQDNTGFDGRWVFTSAGCARIRAPCPR